MKNLSLVLLAAVCASTSVAQAQQSVTLQPGANSKAPSKRELALLTPPVVNLPPSPVGGSDNCANAAASDAIVGVGTFAINTVGATDSGYATSCPIAHNDVWFEWTASSTGQATIQLCTYTTADTVVAVWSGAGCPVGTQLVCNDDSCGLVSLVTFACTSGNIYMIDVGAFGTGISYTASMDISIGAPPPPPIGDDNCGTATVLAGPGLYGFDTSLATTGTEGQAETLCNFFATTAIGNDLWYLYTATTNGSATITTCGQLAGSPSMDSKIAVYPGPGCPVVGTAIACADDDLTLCAQSIRETTLSWPTTCGSTYLIQLGRYPGVGVVAGAFVLGEVGTACSTPVTVYCKGDGTATACPCGNVGAAGNGCGNSLNANGGNLAASGNASVSGDTWVLAGSGVPNGPGLYFQGTTQLNAGLGVVFGDGLRCVGGTVIRLGIVTASGNASTYPTGVTPPNNIVISVKGFCLAGDVRNYQLWYRDSAAFCNPQVFNLTNALNVTWTP